MSTCLHLLVTNQRRRPLMADEVISSATPNPEGDSLLEGAGTKPDGSLLESAGKDELVAKEAEDKRILEADDATLSEEDKGKKESLVKSNEEKRLLEAKEEDLSEEDKVKKSDIVKTKEAAAKSVEVPEKYDIKVPEGMTVNQELLDKISPIFKDKKVSQADAQKIADAYSSIIVKQVEAQKTEFEQFKTDSRKETREALGADADKKLAYIARARDAFFSEETREMLTASGLGDHKSFILDMIKVGKLISEDKLVDGKNKQSPDGAGIETVLYPNQGK